MRKSSVDTKGIHPPKAPTIPHADPFIKISDTIQVNLVGGMITEVTKFNTGNVHVVTRDTSLGTTGMIPDWGTFRLL